MALLIQTDLPGESIREVVHLTLATEILDPIYQTGGADTPVTLIEWGAADALTRAHDLNHTHLAGNLLPATQGQRFSESFAVGQAPAGSVTAFLVAIARYGPNGTDAIAAELDHSLSTGAFERDAGAAYLATVRIDG